MGGIVSLFYDTHCHLARREFAGDLAEVVSRAKAAGIERMVTIATDFESSRRSRELARQFAEVFAVPGWHPSDAEEAPDDIRRELRDLATQEKVVALGETGLDYTRLPSAETAAGAAERERIQRKQASLFQQHLEVAADVGLNVVIHQRAALDDTLRIFEPFAPRVRGVFHCFADDAAAMRRILALGSLVSFTGILTFKNGENIRSAFTETPIGNFMFETDSPFLAPVPYRGKRCEPAYVKEIAEFAAQTRGCSLEDLSASTCATAKSFFRGLG